MSDGERFNNYHLGALVIIGGVLFFGGPFYSERLRSAVDPGLIGVALVALGAWTIIREFLRRRRDRRQR
jgi:uncharacterized membrane protein HdeD (DUF308 family)